MDEEPEVRVRGRPRRRRAVLLVLAALLAIGLLALWLARKPIAADYIDRELARKGVRATYSVKHLGFGRQAVENLVLGDPAHPDLTARYVELRLSWGFRRPRVTLITARGVRLYGRLVGGKLRFGQLDKLLPPPSGAPFRLPDQAVDIADAAIRLDTPAGRLAVAVAGRGNLSDGFSGRLAAAAPTLSLGGCRALRSTASWTVAIRRRAPHVAGPARVGSLACGEDLELRQVGAVVDATVSEAFDRWRGSSAVSADGARAGDGRLAGLSGKLGFAGGAAGETRGRLSLDSRAASIKGYAAETAGFFGTYSVSAATGRVTLAGRTAIEGVNAPREALGGIVAALRSARGTPVEHIAEAWSAALERAARRFTAISDISLSVEGRKGVLLLGDAELQSASGALLMPALKGTAFTWPGGGLRLSASATLQGGGLPNLMFHLEQARPGGALSGTLSMRPYAVGGERLAMERLRFSAAPGGATRIDTVATLDGPFRGGRVAGLVLPITARMDGRGGFAVGESCAAVRFRALQAGSLRLGATRLPLCPAGPALVWKRPGGAVRAAFRVASPRLAGSLGDTPVTLAARDLRASSEGPDFAASGVAVRLGAGERMNRLDVAALSGRVGRRGVEGRYSGLSAALANVPLRLGEGAGDWAFSSGALRAGGAITVADARSPERFHPLVARDFDFALSGNGVTAGGWLFEPRTGTRVARADITHALDSGAGKAAILVPALRFDPGFQPERLTPLTTGVVALVDGTVEGRADIAWDPAGTRSTGTFSTKGMNLAATFGPVENLATTIHFTDLLNLVTAPGQEAQVGVIRTGLDVFDGHIRYQLLPDLKVRVEGARWPFAGGELFLEETILDFSKPTPKRLTFRVSGMDAARFIQQMEFSNISGTGTFDGLVPMIFDEKGGRIVEGRLVARPEGGTLSYIGELTDKQLGAYGKLAFDALKSLRYNKLAVVLNGALDGEFVAGIELDGIARDPAVAAAPGGGIKGMIANRALGQLAKIPFEFNITVRGPFRAVIGTARSLDDPTNLLQSVLPQMLEGRPAPAPIVQPQESETVR